VGIDMRYPTWNRVASLDDSKLRVLQTDPVSCRSCLLFKRCAPVELLTHDARYCRRWYILISERSLCLDFSKVKSTLVSRVLPQ
jgi:hypothetical protein